MADESVVDKGNPDVPVSANITSNSHDSVETLYGGGLSSYAFFI